MPARTNLPPDHVVAIAIGGNHCHRPVPACALTWRRAKTIVVEPTNTRMDYPSGGG